MTREELIEACPPLEITIPTPATGRRRVKIPTIFIVDDIMKCGWEPVETFVRRSKSKNVRHVIVFTSPNLNFAIKNVSNTIIPQLILIGDNGNTPYKMYMSFFRKKCSTRIIVPIKHGGRLTTRNFYLSFRSKDYTSEKVVGTVQSCVQSLIANSQTVFRFVETPLTERQMNHFAAMAFLRRREVQSSLISKRIDNIPSLTTGLLLTPFRPEDEVDNVWNILRRVHEKIIKGFKTFPNSKSKKLVRYKSLVNFEKILRVSIQLYLDIYKITTDETNCS